MCDPKEYESGTLLNSKNIHLSDVKKGKTDREVTRANNDGRLPIEDHNARIIVLGKNGAKARAVAGDIVRRDAITCHIILARLRQFSQNSTRVVSDLLPESLQVKVMFGTVMKG
jgi:hypothetical protein